MSLRGMRADICVRRDAVNGTSLTLAIGQGIVN
jgi:hypothetical protein